MRPFFNVLLFLLACLVAAPLVALGLPAYCVYLLARRGPAARGIALRGLAVAPVLAALLLFLGPWFIVPLPGFGLERLARRLSPRFDAVVPLVPEAWRVRLLAFIESVVKDKVASLSAWLESHRVVAEGLGATSYAPEPVELVLRPVGYTTALEAEVELLRARAGSVG